MSIGLPRADSNVEPRVTVHQRDAFSRDQLTAMAIELGLRLGVLALLLYWSLVLIRPFATIGVWSAILAVSLYPVFDWIAVRLGGRRRLAAAVMTVLSLLVIIGPATW